jgi:hypothetical protein
MDVTLNSPILFYSRRASSLLSPACPPSSTHRPAACGVRPRRASVGRAAEPPAAGGLAKQRRARGLAKQRARLQAAPGGRPSQGARSPPSSAGRPSQRWAGGRAKQPPASRLPPPRRGTDGGCQLQHGCAPTGSVLARALCWLGCRSSLSPCTLGARLCSENGAAGARRSARAASGTASAGPGHSTGARRRLAAQAHLPSAPREVNISNSPSPLSDMVTGDAPIECFVDLMLLSN